jgi:hypothetical protein
MKILFSDKKKGEEGSSLIVYAVIAASVLLAIVGVAHLVAGSTIVTGRRSNYISGQQFAQGGVVIACRDLNTALTSTGSGSVASKLVSSSTPYTRISSLSTASTDVYQRTIAAPFNNQTVVAQIWLPNNSSTPTSAKVTASALVGPVTQTATANVKMNWAYPAAIVSVNAGTTSSSVSKSAAQAGNVVINGDKSGPIVVDGGSSGLAVMANGSVIYDTNYAQPPASAYSPTNWGSANQIPDYTTQGTSNTLFDINRFIAVADLTAESTNFNPTANNHFTNLATFMSSVTTHTSTNPMQGVIVVDVSTSDKNLNNLTDKNLPGGINIHGTWLMNFTGTGWDPVSEKIIVTADININAADLSHVVATNPATYTTGYPPVYTDSTKNPTNIDITARGFSNFLPGDDLPAEIYTIGCLDMHGNANISGVLYTPSYMEIENKTSGNTQYIRGSLIMGNGIYYEDTSAATSIISFDSSAVDSLTTLGGAGKKVSVSYWQ